MSWGSFPPLFRDISAPFIETVKNLKLWTLGAALSFVIFAVWFVWIPSIQRNDPIVESAAAAWNDAISRLGMQPLYPPQEDFFVGDVYLTLTPTESASRLEFPATVFEGKAVKVGHVNLFQSIKKDERPTVRIYERSSGLDVLSLSLRGRPGGVDFVPLTLVAFPGITIRHVDNAEGEWFILGAESKFATVDEISIEKAQTYSAPLGDAFVALDKFCKNRDTDFYCDDVFGRKLLSYTLGKRVNAVYEGQYVFKVSVLLIQQVYVTSTLSVSRRYLNKEGYEVMPRVETISKPDAAHTKAPLPIPPTLPRVDGPSGGPVGEGESPGAGAIPKPSGPVQPIVNDSAVGQREEREREQEDITLGRGRSGASRIGLSKTYDAPLVFGFRSVIRELEPAKPLASEPATTQNR